MAVDSPCTLHQYSPDFQVVELTCLSSAGWSQSRVRIWVEKGHSSILQELGPQSLGHSIYNQNSLRLQGVWSEQSVGYSMYSQNSLRLQNVQSEQSLGCNTYSQNSLRLQHVESEQS